MAFDANIANILIVALTNLNMTLIAGSRERKIVNYLTFSKRGDEDIDDFIIELKKVFAVNKVFNNRKHLIIASYLKRIAVNFYDELAEITGWNVTGQATNTQLKLILET